MIVLTGKLSSLSATMSLHGKRKEIYKYEAPWTVYAMNWSVRPDKRFRLALGSFVEEYNNKVTGEESCMAWVPISNVRSCAGMGTLPIVCIVTSV